MRCIAIDDEPIALEILRQFCGRMENLQIDTYTNPREGMDAILRVPPDIVFIDIEMGDTSGLDLAAALPEDCFLVFTTAYARYAVDGFDMDAADFLHKPFSFERFRKTIDKIGELEKLRRLRKESDAPSGSITVMSGYKNTAIPLADIEYIESMNNYLCIRLAGGDYVNTLMNMKDFLAMTPEGGFIRIHKSFIVPVRHIRRHNRKELTLASGKTLPVGRAYADNLADKTKSFTHPSAI